MNARLIVAIISTLLEETAMAVVVLFGLPQLDIEMPLAGLIILMVAWLAVSVVVYRIGSRALRQKPLDKLPDMVGSQCKVVSPLAPEGLISIKGELWIAKSAGAKTNLGDKVVVVEQDGLRLVVRKAGSGGLKETE